jgi:hypothetical protein
MARNLGINEHKRLPLEPATGCFSGISLLISLPCPVPVHLPVPLIASCGLKTKKGLYCSLLYPLLNLPNTNCGADGYTRAECNTILLYDHPHSLHYIYTSTCVYVTLTRHCWAPLSTFFSSVSLLQIVKRTVFFSFVLAM